jgi:hypothetical protein
MLCCVDMQALPLDNQPLKPANATKLSVWICEGDKGIDDRLFYVLEPSHTLILWAASLCRISSGNVFSRHLAGDWEVC